MRRIMGKVIFLLLFTSLFLIFGRSIVNAAAVTKYIFDDTTGGDCISIGTWDPGTKTCTLTTDISGDYIQIEGNGITLDGNGHKLTGSGIEYGVNVQTSDTVTVKNTIVDNYFIGIFINKSQNTVITGNTVMNSKQDGIYDNYSYKTTASYNIVTNAASSAFQIQVSDSSQILNNNVSNNTYGIKLDYPTNILVENNSVIGSSFYGIPLFKCQNCIVKNNKVTNSDNGIGVSESTGTIIETNEVIENHFGMYHVNSSGSIVLGNIVDKNGVNGGYGFVFTSSNANTIKNNVFTNNDIAALLFNGANDNLVYGNTLSNNIDRGIWLQNSSNNQVYNNNFIGNYPGHDAVVEGGENNLFNLPKPIGGNFWDTWTTPDDDHDGFVDQPYVFQIGQDNLPWAVKDGWTIPPVKIVTIDIKPGAAPNCFNNDGHGVIPVAIMGSIDFDATQIDPGSVSLNGQSVKVAGKSDKYLAHTEDVNGDGFMDLIVQIIDTDGTYQLGDTVATLTGKTFSGQEFTGTDTICIKP